MVVPGEIYAFTALAAAVLSLGLGPRLPCLLFTCEARTGFWFLQDKSTRAKEVWISPLLAPSSAATPAEGTPGSPTLPAGPSWPHTRARATTRRGWCARRAAMCPTCGMQVGLARELVRRTAGHPPGDQHRQCARSNLGQALKEAGEYASAEALLRDVMAIHRRVFGPTQLQHPHRRADR